MNSTTTGKILQGLALSAALVIGAVAQAHVSAPTEAVPALTGKTVCVAQPVRLAVVGDSISSWNPAFAGNKWQSWVYTATDNAMPLVGGYAFPGAKLAELAAGSTYTGADVLVIMGGTNDLPIMALGIPGTPVVDRFRSIDLIAQRVGADRVVLSAVAPFGWNYYESNTWNAQLKVYAQSKGWTFIDPWVGARDPQGAWWAGTDYGDLVHPNPSTAGYIGQQIRAALNGLP